ncbi:putative thioredoxin reductase [Rosellinia necatrix]|uniref:Putative thioredoxin reductase n=1 Tax=Rosellinia necatrix TaxID=77044 RepID=A0A1W2TCH8_ROSNE|nr:putative thioredoxin reductase [Rosellinia necatrix]
MSPFTAVLLSILAVLANAAPILLPSSWTDYDVIVVGGGPAGLAALSALARVRRNALLIDSGDYRNTPTRLMHDVIGFDGVRPAYFRWVAQQQVAHYKTVKMTNGTVTDIQPEADNAYFTVSMTGFDGTVSSLTARKIILATGLRDILAPTPGLQENFGKGIYWCPWCDGIEHADQPMGILGSFDRAARAAAEVMTLNSDVIIFANGTDTPENRARADKVFAENSSEYLQKRNIKVDNRIITRITRLRDGGADHTDPSLPSMPEYDLFRVDFASGPSVERNTFFYTFDNEQRSPLGERAGVRMVDGMMAVDDNMLTSVPGIYAVGDANSDERTNVGHALYTGKSAVVHLHMELEKETSRSQKALPLTAEKEDEGREETRAKVWAQLKSSPTRPIYIDQFPL